jgi:hypothetical protein
MNLYVRIVGLNELAVGGVLLRVNSVVHTPCHRTDTACDPVRQISFSQLVRVKKVIAYSRDRTFPGWEIYDDLAFLHDSYVHYLSALSPRASWIAFS